MSPDPTSPAGTRPSLTGLSRRNRNRPPEGGAVAPFAGCILGQRAHRQGLRLEEVVPAASEYEQRLQEYEREVTDLQGQLKALEEEVVGLRRRLQDAPKRVRTLEERLLETKGQLAQALSQNERLSATLREAREHIAALREEVEKLTMPPNGYGTYLGTNDDGTVDIFSAGRKMRVALHPEIESEE